MVHICPEQFMERRQGSENTMQPTGFYGQQPESTDVIPDCLGRSMWYEKPLFSKVSSILIFFAIPHFPAVSVILAPLAMINIIYLIGGRQEVDALRLRYC
jgi:hypothetical protein